MIQTIRKAWGIPELRKKIIFTLLILLIFRIGNAITVPYINKDALQIQLASMGSTYFGLLNTMSGGAFSMGKDEIASKLAAVRALNGAKEQGQDLVTLCSACHNVLKQANDAMAHDEEFSEHANNYMQLEKPYKGETRVIHYLELLRDVVGFDNLKKAVVKPLTGKKVAAYYGCLLLRPSKVMQMDNPENPTIIEDFLRAIGAEPVLYANRNECCGGYAVLEDRAIAQKKSTAVMHNAADMQAEMLVTACPLCQYNLTKNSAAETQLPVYYFTELLAEALGVKE